ncbi:MAG: SET domain-containing protein-lysine N-methyltransferase [Ginsengibacter sp.]
MQLIKKDLYIKRSGIPKAGKGLFTKKCIPKGTRIVEYTGNITTWRKVLQSNVFNGYVFYINRNHVIDAKDHLQSPGRYVNDANGLIRIKGIVNNSRYSEVDGSVFIEATKDIPAGSEIFVSYRKEYWNVIKYNLDLKESKKRNGGKKI